MYSTKYAWLTPVAASLLFVRCAIAGEFFDPGLLQSVNGNMPIGDTSSLSQGRQPPGIYRVKINANGKSIIISDVRFEQNKDQGLVPCLSFSTLQKLGVDMDKVESGIKDNEQNNACVPVETQLPGIKTDFDFAKLELNIAIPQTLLRDETLKGIPPEEWDDGIPAVLSMYQLSGQQYLSKNDNNQNSVFANLTNGVNIGRWRYRNNSTLSNTDGWHSTANFLETAIRSLKGELTLGDANTSGDVFDGLLIRGIQLSSDLDMVPDQLTGFAPIIRGIAKSNAQVTVRDNGRIVYQRSVPQGPFVISDIASVSSGGKLDVTVTEADGSETHSTVDYSSVPQLLREGQVKYNLSAGRFLTNTSSLEDDPQMAQATLSWGLPLNITAYGGVQLQERYKALSIGIGLDLHRLGGIAIDTTHSDSGHDNLPDEKGSMLRLTYHNNIPETDTQIQLDSRYYRRKYNTFSDWANAQTLQDDSRESREFNLTINQALNSDNSFFTTLSRIQNADRSVSRSFQLGWNSSISIVSFSLMWNMSKSEGQPEWDKQLALTLSVPFSSFYPNAQPMLNYTATSGMKGDLSNQIGMTGKVGDRQDLNWNTQVSYASQNGQSDTKSGSAGLDYQGGYGDINATFNADENQYLSWNASGSLLAHQHGVTFGRYSGGSQALVSIPGAKDVGFQGIQNVSTDSRGYAMVTDLQSYHRNTLQVDTNASKNIDFTSTSAEVIPTKDAVVLAKFTAISGRKVVLEVKHNGNFLPFGARARLKEGRDIWYVGDEGQVYLNAAPESGVVNFNWGESDHCSAHFKLPEIESVKSRMIVLPVECH